MKIPHGSLRGNFVIRQDHAITDESSANSSQLFDRSKEIDDDSLTFNLPYIAPKVLPTIEFHESILFDFYDVTQSANRPSNNTC